MDTITPEKRSENMRRIKSKGMKPEMLVGKLVHGMGYRYRLHRKDLPGKPDLIFSSRQSVTFVHGCFWHQHSDPGCPIVRTPKSNQDYWLPKLKRNQERDNENIEALKEQGWEVLVIWECQTKNPEKLKGNIDSFLKNVK